jgi:hypothetical protein
VQRITEAGLLLLAFFTGDLRFAHVTFSLTLLQALSPRLAPIAVPVALLAGKPSRPEVGDLYFDFGATRGACAISVLVQALGLWLVSAGYVGGFVALAIPAASFLLAPTVGFCCGCAVYVLGRELLARLGFVARCVDGACDVDVGEEAASRPQ